MCTENVMFRTSAKDAELRLIDFGSGTMDGLEKTQTDNAEKNNISIYDMQDFMRHKDINTTIKHYKKYQVHKLKEKLDTVQSKV